MRTAANGIEIEYETFGNPDDPPVLLVMGLGAQMTFWLDAFCRQLVDGGRYVIRFDNRDAGLSTKFQGTVDMMSVLTAIMSGQPVTGVPYLLSDMSDDAFGVLDALGIDRAHIVGASMGGMIVQTMAIAHPERVLSMTSIMSTTGEMEVGQPTPEVMANFLTPPPTEREAFLDASIAGWKMFSSKRYFDGPAMREVLGAAYDRCFCPEGTARQMAAIMASGSRADGLRKVEVPSLVIHGRDDTLVTPSGGERTAELIPGARLLMLDDMGHDMPEPLWPDIVGAILEHTAPLD